VRSSIVKSAGLRDGQRSNGITTADYRYTVAFLQPLRACESFILRLSLPWGCSSLDFAPLARGYFFAPEPTSNAADTDALARSARGCLIAWKVRLGGTKQSLPRRRANSKSALRSCRLLRTLRRHCRLKTQHRNHEFGRNSVAKKPLRLSSIEPVIQYGCVGENTAPTAGTSGGWGVTIGTAAFPEGKAARS
jgi:hypothetical protein